MQPVNDDMDHLFRQAANDYPLNTQGADFDKLQQRMQAPEAEVLPKKEGRQRYTWLLLLLLAIPFVCRHYYTSQTAGTTPLATQQNPKKAVPQPASISSQKNTAAAPDKTIATNTQHPSTSNTQTTTKSKVDPNGLTNALLPTNLVATQQPNSNAGSSFLPGQRSQVPTKISVPDNAITTQIHRSKTRQYKSVNNKQNSSKQGVEYGDSGAGDMAKQGGLKSHLPNENELVLGTTISMAKQNDRTDSLSQTDSTHRTNKPTDTANAIVAQKAIAKDSTAIDSILLVKKQPTKSKKPSSYFYTGLIAGLDYSVVKSTQTAGTGFNAGIVAGYRFGKHLAVETGFMWAYKKYRSEGEYVSTENLDLALHTQVLYAAGSCGIFEIPLNLQYHFSSKQNGHWYAGAGFSSYLMKKENYYYMGKRYNMQYYAEKEYFNSTSNWFSILQLSGGYQWQLGKRASLRAEPYFKLPVSRIGIARLPLSSAGLNIGYTMPL